MHGHLVAVEVGVEGGADQRVKLDCLALDQKRLERLNAETVKRRRPVEQHRMLADDFFENVPNFRAFLFQHTLGGLDGGRHAIKFQFRIDEGLEQFQGHLLGQAALMQHQLRADHDDRTAGIIDALAEQILTETALLALQHIGKGFQRPFVGAGNGTPATTVVEQGVDGFLKHSLFVADDDLRRTQFDQPFQAVVAVDHPTVEVIQVRGGEPPAVQRHQRAQLGRDDRDFRENHPFRPGVGIDEGLHQLQAFNVFFAFGFRIGFLEVDAQIGQFFFQVDGGQHFPQRLGADADGKGVLAVFCDGRLVFLFAEGLMQFQRRQPRFDHHIGLEVKHPLKAFQRHVEQQADTRRQ